MLALGALVSAPAGARSTGILPPEIASQVDADYIADFDEPAMWRPREARGYRTRIRLSISGIVRAKASIRIDESASGKLYGTLAFHDYGGVLPPDGEVSVTSFAVTHEQWEDLQRRIASSKLWSIYPEFYNGAAGDICIDGEELILERVDASSYRFATANAQCTAPREVLEIAAAIIDIAKARRIRPWLG